MSDTSLVLAGSWNATPAVSVVQFASNLEVTALVWNAAIGIYHFLLVYALNKYGMRIWFWNRDRSDSISWWKGLGTNYYGQAGTSPVMDDEVLRRKLEILAEKGWGTTTSPPHQAVGMKEAAQATTIATGEEVDEEDRDEGELAPTTISHSLSCFLVLAFQCSLSDEQIYEWADKMRRMFGSTPRVERFESSTIVQTSVWTHEGLLHDAAALVQEGCEKTPHCTLQLDTWGVFLNDAGPSTGEKVKLIKLQGLNVPVITSASQSSAVDMLEIRGRHLDEADLIAQTHDQSMRLLSKSKAPGDSGDLEALCVECPPDALHQDLHVYASKTVAANGSLISVQCEPEKVISTDDNLSTTDSTSWIIAALVTSVPVTQIALSLLYPSSESPLAIMIGQGLGWILGWLTRKLFTARNPSNQGKTLRPAVQKKEDEELQPLSETRMNRDGVPCKPVPSKPAVQKRDFSKYFRRGGWVVLFVLLILLSHWLWTHMGAFEKKWLLIGTTTATIGVIVLKLLAKLRKTKVGEIVSPSRYWMNLMSTAITYNEWTHAASMLLSHNGFNESELYDEAYVQGKLRELQTRRMKGATQEILFFLRADLIRHLGNMCNPNLHRRRNEVPAVIRDYIDEVRNHLQAICEMDVEEFTLEEKITFLTETRQRFGRTALVFCGHVALGTFHSSVFRTLVEHQLLPSVIVGANLGAIVASFATTRTASELRHFFDDPSLPMDFYEKLSTVYVAAYRLRTQEARPYEIEKLQQSMQDLLGDLTFEEAFDLSGRTLGISIPACPLGHQPAQFLNYLASPHVVIWSAVAVSCVPPSGLLHQPELMIKDRYDRIVPYVPPTKMTKFQKAGSETRFEADIPFRQVEELFNVNHFIVSQASPYISPWLHFKESTEERSPLAAKLVNMIEMEVRHRCAQLLDMGIRLRGFTSLCAQKWEGDINITLPITFSQAISKATTQKDEYPSPNELRKAAMEGRRCTWAKLSAIHASCRVELMLDEYINELHRRERHALHQGEDYHPLNDLASLKGTCQSDLLDIGRANVNTAQSSQGDNTSNANDELPLELLTPKYSTTSEAETEDYLLDHLCSCTSKKPESLMRCDVAAAVSDERVHHVEEECDTIDYNHGAWSGESHLPDELTIKDYLQQPANEEQVVIESVCQQHKLQNRDLQLEWDFACEDVDSYGSPTTVLEGPGGQSTKVVDRITHPGCNLERYFEEMSNSSCYHLDERDDDI